MWTPAGPNLFDAWCDGRVTDASVTNPSLLVPGLCGVRDCVLLVICLHLPPGRRTIKQKVSVNSHLSHLFGDRDIYTWKGASISLSVLQLVNILPSMATFTPIRLTVVHADLHATHAAPDLVPYLDASVASPWPPPIFKFRANSITTLSDSCDDGRISGAHTQSPITPHCYS